MGCGIPNRPNKNVLHEESPVDQTDAEVIIKGLSSRRLVLHCGISYNFKSRGETYCIKVSQAKTPETSVVFT
ncbi:unnamed protein product [Blepharisma stoltei]|uniref:Uncharacterized protein n=1 Tax=Blepharisma stoltei TaxID=1481888 RepID=A0AAU9K9B3_9CILI|nr:unnamed protein product [Blepharisma stoltei]